MADLSIPIIPVEQIFYNINTLNITPWEKHWDLDLDHQAIATFCALGFMLDDDTFYKDIKTLHPATKYTLNENNKIIDSKKYWQWNYNPRDISFSNVLDEFANLFEKLIQNQVGDKSILLPISGGLDSRTIFASLKNTSNVHLCSYEFEDGILESETGKILSEIYKIPFYSQKIQKGYLWHKLDDLYKLNDGFTDFTHPRQIAAINQWKGLGDIILLGHWGDVLFDKHADLNNISYDKQLLYLKDTIIKPEGNKLAENLWKIWGLEGTFDLYITDRLNKLYNKINIEYQSARIRAFKSLYWAPRWTSINLSIFSLVDDIVLPYYTDEMCQFICSIQENYLAGRKIQIEYIKKTCPNAAQIPWQKYSPLNLYQYHKYNSLTHNSLRAIKKLKRLLMKQFSTYPNLITRNWELQFLGENNFIQLKKRFLKQNKVNEIIPKELVKEYLDNFQKNPVKYAQPLSMLLTLLVFSDRSNQ